METAELVQAWRDIINSPEKSWVVFENGTCVMLLDPEEDLAAQATALLREWGPVYPSTNFGDFGTITLDDGRGWVVTCHHDDIFSLVRPDEVPSDATDFMVGLLGRLKRGMDAEELRVLHVEDKRPA